MRSNTSSIEALALVLVLGIIGINAVLGQFTCEQAVELHKWALKELESCENPDTQNTTLCELVGEYEDQPQPSPAPQSDQLQLVNDPDSNIDPWQNYLVQSAMSSFGDPADVAYVLSLIQPVYSNLSSSGDITSDEYYAAWQEPWYQQAELNMQLAANLSSATRPDKLGISETYWKACNYYFTGFWPSPFSLEARQKHNASVNAFNLGLSNHPTYTSKFFNVSFNNGTATAQLPGVFITPNASAKLPLVIITGGTDFPKELNVLNFGTGPLSRQYALLVYDGPGQGSVVRNPPYMPFYPDWDQVFEVILDYTVANLTQYVDTSNIFNAGVSLGGYLSSVTCSKIGQRVRACVPNPPIVSDARIYQKTPSGLAEGLYGGFTYAGQQDANSLPNGYAQAFQNGTGIINTLFLTCNASSPAPQLIADAFSISAGGGPLDPEIIYLSGGYGGVMSGDRDVLASGIWQAYRNSQNFGTYDIANISVPVVGGKGTQDTLLGGSEDEFFSKLSPSVASSSTLLVFDEASGGALHDQVGNPGLQDTRFYTVLDGLLASQSSPSPASG